MINSKDKALSSLPKVPIELGDKVFPARVILNTLITNQTYLLKNTNTVLPNDTLDEHTNWNTLEPQTTYAFKGLGKYAPDENILGTDTGLVTTFSTQDKNNPMTFEIVITSKGIAYHLVGDRWSYLGHQVPDNIDADNLIDKEHLNDIFKSTLTSYVTNLGYSQDKASNSVAMETTNRNVSSVSAALSSTFSSTDSSFNSFSNDNSNQISSLRAKADKNSENIDTNYDNINYFNESASSLADQMNGSLGEDDERYAGVFGINGLNSEVSANTNRLDSSADSMQVLKGSVMNLQTEESGMTRGYEDIGEQLQSAVDKSNAENLPMSVYYNSSEISSLVSSLSPWASQNAQLLDSIATTTYTGSYAEVDTVSDESLAVSDTPSNFSPIIKSAFFQKGIPYEFTANVAIKSENVSVSPNYPIKEDVTGTIGFEAQNENGIAYQLYNNSQYSNPVAPQYFPDNVSNPIIAENDQYVAIQYPSTNVDIDTQLHDHLVDVIFIPKANEKLNIVSVPAISGLEPATFSNVSLIEHLPLTQKYNTNSLLAGTAESMADLATQYHRQTSVNNSNIILNNSIANEASNNASQATSYLNSTPRMSLAPTYSYANSCSTNNPSYIYLYPNYDNDKEEKALDWCLTEITPAKVKVYGNWPANTPEQALVNQVKNLAAGIIGNIEAVEDMMGGAVSDPQNPDIVQDWSVVNYLNWNLTSDYDTSSILNYLNSTLKREPNQEWDGWEAYLGLQGNADDCASWLSSQIKNGASNASSYADDVRKLLY